MLWGGGTITGDLIVSNTISEGGTLLSAKYLGILDKAADADKLDNLDSTYFTNATNLASGTIHSDRISGSYTGITGLGDIAAGAWKSTTIGTQYGGTGQNWSATTKGSVPYFSADGTMSAFSSGTAGQFLKSQGTDSAPTWTNTARTATFVVATTVANGGSLLSQQQADYVCDGTNDQEQIQAAINALPSGGGRVMLLEGSFTFSNKVLINKDNVEIVGQGKSITKIVGDPGADIPFFEIYNTAIETRNRIRIAHFSIDGTNHTASTTLCAAIFDSGGGNVTNLLVENLYIKEANNYNGGVQFENDNGTNENIIIKNCEIEVAGLCAYGIIFRKHTQYVWVEENYINVSHVSSYNSLGIYGGSTFVNVCNNYIHGNGHTPLALSSASYVNIIGNIVDASSRSGEGGIEVEWKSGHKSDTSSHHIIIIGNLVYNGNWGIYTHNRNDDATKISYNIIIKDNIVENCTKGIYLYSGNNISVAGNMLSNNTVAFEAESGVNYIAYNQQLDLFMDVLVASTNAVHAAITGTGAELEVDTAITNPDVPRNISITNSANSTGDVVITGVDAKGNSVTDTITISTGATAYGVVAFSTVSKITLPATVANPDTIAVGISDKLGLSNIIYATSDVYKIKKNNADATVAVAQVNTTYDTYDMSVIGLGGADDFTIYYKSNLNIIE